MSEGQLELAELERDVRKLPGVRFARLVAERSRIKEVHVVSDGSKAPKQLIRDIETLAKAAFDLDIDHRVISITEFPDTAVAAVEHPFVLVSLSITTTAGVASCAVVAGRADERSEATESAPASRGATLALVARTTRQAAAVLARSSEPAHLEACEVLPAGDGELAVVAFTFVNEDGTPATIAGACPVATDANDAVARATLDVVERRSSA